VLFSIRQEISLRSRLPSRWDTGVAFIVMVNNATKSTIFSCVSVFGGEIRAVILLIECMLSVLRLMVPTTTSNFP